jgi:hypothetical protein
LRFYSIHERRYGASPAAAGALLDGLSSREDTLWPGDRWPAQRFDRPLGPGAGGGHGPIRYEVVAYEPGRRVDYRFLPEGAGLSGSHWFEVVPTEGGVVLRHVIDGRAALLAWLRWQLVYRWLHDALLRDALDNAERELTGHVVRPAQYNAWVRLLRSTVRRRAAEAPASSPG